MASNPIPSDLRRFIAKHISSVEQLEVLCLLSRKPDKSWTVPEVLREIQSSEKSVAECLETFRLNGLAVGSPETGYRFAPAEEELVARTAELVKAYHERRVSVIETIYAKPTDSIQDFAEAFRLRKEKQ